MTDKEWEAERRASDRLVEQRMAEWREESRFIVEQWVHSLRKDMHAMELRIIGINTAVVAIAVTIIAVIK